MNDRTASQRYDQVQFRFLGQKEEWLCGSVLSRPDGMVLDITGTGSGPYHIAGKRTKGSYAGENTDADRRFDVTAKWADVGDVFVGEWIEEGFVYLFSFSLPSSPH